MRQIDLSAIRERLASASGPKFWRSLEEVAETPEFQEMLHREFPQNASEWSDPGGRRDFLKLMGASLALAGASACVRLPRETIVPYVRMPEEIVPGKPLFYATALVHGGAATPVLVESHMGRPTKIEPNPEHPSTKGGTDVFAQAEILNLYDPDRSQTVRHQGEISTWAEAQAAIKQAIAAKAAAKGAGLRILTEACVSPTMAAQMRGLLQQLPDAQWHRFEPVCADGARAGSHRAFGRIVDTVLDVSKADVILSLDGDFLNAGGGRLRYTRDFSDRRRLVAGKTTMNRLYVAESTPTVTGGMADHRLSLKAGAIEALARAIAAGVGVTGASGSAPQGVPAAWVAAVAEDLKAHAGKSIVVAGHQQPASVHALAHAMNAALGNVGTTVSYIEPIEAEPVEHLASIEALAKDMAAGKVDVLVIAGANPVYAAPADLDFALQMEKVAVRVHLGLWFDETAAHCHWHVPQSHSLESWSDARAFDGVATIAQPLIAPLYESKSAIELVATMNPTPDGRPEFEIVRDFWKAAFEGRASGGVVGCPSCAWTPPADGPSDFDAFWRRSLHDGFVAGTRGTSVLVAPSSEAVGASGGAAGGDGLEITFSADPTVYDGRYGNNGWMQELPKPMTKVTWENVALVAPSTAERLGLRVEQDHADVAELAIGGRKVRATVVMQPGQPADSINVQFGYGRTRGGRLAMDDSGAPLGFSAYALRSTSTPWFASGLTLTKTGDSVKLARTQGHFNMEGREIVKDATLAAYTANPAFAHGHDPKGEDSLFGQPWKYDGYAWGMVIDLGACTGCGACMVSCQAENNISVVGKAQVMVSREMHWIRVDRYFSGDPDNPRMFNQPVPCMQCENAPCEVVCPVAATTHSTEGLNDMVYNRCVGTRYCSNNCPYKVRRFNFLLYADWDTPSLKMQRNPDVTVRSRGIMEKCTYCVQRINHARIQAKLEDRSIRDGEIVTACEAACPAAAITFGNVNDPESRVAKLKNEPRNYSLLAELGTRPRTTYLAAVRNPNPRLESAEAAEPTAHH
ncbi:MAG: TAT-variant-translocated molybdopterin oxidoreductase [Vicinamibacterales bacterium]